MAVPPTDAVGAAEHDATAAERAVGPDLFGLLCVSLLLDLAVARLAVPLLRPDLLEDLPRWYSALYQAGAFIHYFTAMLACLTGGYYLVRAGMRRRLFRAPVRALLSSATVVFVPLCALTIVDGALRRAFPAVVRFDLRMAYLAIVLLLALGLWVRRAGLGARLAMSVMALPLLLWAAAAVWAQAHPDEPLAGVGGALRGDAQWAALLAPLGLFACLLPWPMRRALRRPAPILGALAITIVAALLQRFHGDTLMQAVRDTLGIELPLDPRELTVFGTALFCGAAVVLTLLGEGAARRRMGLGALLVAGSGITLYWGADLAISLCGYVAFALGAARDAEEEAAHAIQPSPARWRDWAQALAGALPFGAEATARPRVVQSVAGARDGGELTVISGARDGYGVRIRVRRGALGVERLSIEIGDGVPDAALPGFTLEGGAAGPRRTLAGMPAVPGPRVLTGDRAIDAQFLVHDAAALTRALLDDDVRTRLLARFDGWLGVWPDRAVRFVAPPADDGAHALIPLAPLASPSPDAPPVVELLGPLLGAIDALIAVARRARVPPLGGARAAEPPAATPAQPA